MVCIMLYVNTISRLLAAVYKLICEISATLRLALLYMGMHFLLPGS